MPYMQNCNAGNHTGRLTADSTAAPTNRPGNNTLVPHPADYAAARRRRGRPGPGPGAARMPHIALDINPSCPTGAGPISFCGPVHPLARPRHAARLSFSLARPAPMRHALHIPPLPECRATPREWLDVPEVWARKDCTATASSLQAPLRPPPSGQKCPPRRRRKIYDAESGPRSGPPLGLPQSGTGTQRCCHRAYGEAPAAFRAP